MFKVRNWAHGRSKCATINHCHLKWVAEQSSAPFTIRGTLGLLMALKDQTLLQKALYDHINWDDWREHNWEKRSLNLNYFATGHLRRIIIYKKALYDPIFCVHLWAPLIKQATSIAKHSDIFRAVNSQTQSAVRESNRGWKCERLRLVVPICHYLLQKALGYLSYTETEM